MNYYNPYFYMAPMSMTRPSLFASLRGALGGSGLTLGNIINGTQKTLGLVNQAIPIIKQVTPVMKNARTMFKVMNEFKKADSPSDGGNNDTNNIPLENADMIKETKLNDLSVNSGPTFFA